MGNLKLLAVDPSLRQSGWAMFNMGSEMPISWGVIRPEPEKGFLGNRLLSLQEQISALYDQLSLSTGDVLVCEGPAPISLNPSSSIKVEQVRGIFEAVARERRVEVPGRVNPRTVQTELLGFSGKQRKREEVKAVAKTVVKNILGICPDQNQMEQDVVDAILIGLVSLSRIKRASIGKVSLVEIFSEKGNQSRGRGSGRGMRWVATGNLKFK